MIRKHGLQIVHALESEEAWQVISEVILRNIVPK